MCGVGFMGDAAVLDFETLVATMSASAIIFYFLIPTFALILVIVGIRKFRIRRRRVKINKKFMRATINENNLKDIESEPKDKSKYRSLSLSFDEKGRVIE